MDGAKEFVFGGGGVGFRFPTNFSLCNRTMDYVYGYSADRLTRWLADHGVELDRRVVVERDPVTGLGLYTRGRLRGENRILSVPSGICISSVSAFDAISKLFPNAATLDIPKERWTIVYIFLVQLLISGMQLQEIKIGIGQHAKEGLLLKHVGYVSTIPENILTPLHFRPKELELLKATPLHGAAIEALRHTRAEFEKVFAWLSSQTEPPEVGSETDAILRAFCGLACRWHSAEKSDTYQYRLLETYRWSTSVLHSRAFPPSLLGPELSPDAGPVLIPGLDVPNHARSKAVTWSYQPPPSALLTPPAPSVHSLGSCAGKVTLTTRYDLERNMQLFNNYGPKSNEELLASYAFVLPEGEDDYLTLKLNQDASADVLTSDPAGRGEREAGTYRWLRSSVSPPPGLLEEIRSRLVQSGSSQPSDGDNATESGKTAELQLQVEVLETLEVLLVQKRRSFRAVQAEIEATLAREPPVARDRPDKHYEPEELTRDKRAPIREDVWSMIQVYRQGQLAILNQAIRWTRRQLESVDDQLDELHPDETTTE